MIPTSEQDKMAEIIRMIGSQTNRTSIMSQQPPLLQPQPPRIPFMLSSTAPPQTTTTPTPTVANMNIHHHHHNNNNNHNNNMFSISLPPQQQQQPQQLQQQLPQVQQPFQQQHVQQQQPPPVHLQSYQSPISFVPQQPQPQQMTAFEKQQHQLMQQQQQLQKQYEQLQQQQLQFQQQQLQLQMQYEKISPNSCKHCRDSHRRCDRKLPSCTQCSKRSIQCHYVPSKKRKNESPAIILQQSQQSLLTTTGNNNKHRNNNNTSSSSSNDDSESDSNNNNNNNNRMELMMSRPLKQARVEYNNNHHTVEQSSSLFSSSVSSMSSSSSLSTTSSSNVHSPPLLSTIQQQQQQQQEVYQVLNQIPHLLASQQHQHQHQQQHQTSQITTLPHDNIMNHNSNNLSSMKNNNDNNSNNHSSISNNDYQRLYLATSQISDKFITMTSREPIIQLSAAVAAVANSSSSHSSSFNTLQQQQQQQQHSQSSLPSPSSSSTASPSSSINSPSPSYTSESSPINTSASDSNDVAMVHHHQQQQQQPTPPPLLSLSSSPAVASVSILEACFDLIEPQNAGKDFKESVIAQLLWNQMTSKSSLASSSSSSTSPLSSSTANADDRSAIANMSQKDQEQRAQQVLEEKANQALWYSIQAVALLHMPSKEQEPYFDAQKRMMIYEIMSKKLGQYKATSQNDTTFFPCSFGVNTEFLLKRKRSEMEDHNDENDDDENGENDIEDKDNGDKDNNELAKAISELPDLARLFCKFSKLQLIETARLMFNSARTLLLDVEVFPHIGTHMKLAQTSAHLVSFLLVSGERTEEAHVFLNSAKVYLDRVRDVLRLDATKLSGHARDQLETQQLAIGGLYSAYTSLKSVLYVNYAPRTSDFYRKKSLKKYLKLSIRAWKAVGNTSRRVLWSQDCQNPLRKLKAIINRNPEDATHDRRQLYDFLMGCREMRGNIEHCSGFTRIWRLFTFTIDIFALEIFASQAGTCKDKSFFDVLWELQLETAHLVIREIYSSLGLVITAGARLLMIIKFTCRIHIEHSARLCSGSTNKKELLECLAFMHTDSLTLDAIGLRTPVAALQELSEQIKLQQQYHQQYLAQLDGSSWLTNAPNSTLSNQDNGKSDISLGSISNITSCDGDEKGEEEPATQFFGSIYETFQSGGDFTQEQPVAEETNFFLEFFNLEEGFQ